MNLDLAWCVTGLVTLASGIAIFVFKEKNNTLTQLETRIAVVEMKQAVQSEWNRGVDEKLDRIIRKLEA